MLLTLATLVAGALTVAGVTTPAQTFTDRGHADFASQAAAQSFFGAYDRRRL